MTSARHRQSFLYSGCALFALGLMAGPAMAATYTVTSASGNPAVVNSLGWAISQANANAGEDTIEFNIGSNVTIGLGGTLPVITDSVTIDGSGSAGLRIHGNNAYNIFLVRADGTDAPATIDVTISNVTLQNARAQGGSGLNGGSNGGGGGGLGAGGAILVGKGGNVIVEDVTFASNAAVGGTRGTSNASYPTGAGGGGLNGGTGPGLTGWTVGTGGGGYGRGADATVGNGTVAGVGGGPNGGTGGTTSAASGNGGDWSGGGGGAVPSSDNNNGRGGDGGYGGGGGGGGSGTTGIADQQMGGNGGFGGGGAGATRAGGTMGFGGDGGYGAGGGATRTGETTSGGFGGTDGNGATAGVGAAFGGSIFVEDGGTIEFKGNVSMTGGTVSAQTGALALGSAIFLHGTTGLSFNPDTGEIVTIANNIDSDAYNSGEDPSDPDAARDGLDTGITKTGDGTLILQGTNSFVGGVDIQGGTVSIATNSNLGHSDGELTISNEATLLATGNLALERDVSLGTGGGAFAANGSTVLTVNGIVSGSEGLIKNGSGIVVLNNAANSYTGGTTINAGTLRAGADGALAEGSMDIAATGLLDLNNFDQVLTSLTGATGSRILLGSGDLTIDQAIDTSFDGTISGTGDVIKAGAGTLTISNPFGNTGEFILEGGTIAAGAANIFNNRPVILDDGATFDLGGFNQTVARLESNTGSIVNLEGGTLTLTDTTTYEIAGTLAGNGDVVKQGTGNVTFSGVGTMSGTFTVAGGSMNLTGSLADGIVSVSSGGNMYGTGTVGDLMISGIIAPGNIDPDEIIANGEGPEVSGVLNITNDATFRVGSMLLLDMAVDGTISSLNVGGATTIEGGTVYVADDEASFSRGQTYTILTSAGGITGQFDELRTDLVFLSPELEYGTNEIRMIFAPNFNASMFGGNQRRVGEAIDFLIGDVAPGVLNDMLEELSSMDINEAHSVLWNLAPEVYGDASASVGRMMAGGNRMITNRFSRRTGDSGLAALGVEGPAPAADIAYVPELGMQFWTDYQFRTVDLGYDGNASRGSATEHTQLFGGDIDIPGTYLGQGMVGAYAGMMWADLGLEDITQKSSLSGPVGGIYGQWSPVPILRFHGRAAIAAPRVSSRRSFGVGPVQVAAKSEYRMVAAGGHAGVAYDKSIYAFLFTPFAEGGVQYMRRPDFAEEGADDAGLEVEGAERLTGEARVGARLATLPMPVNETWSLIPTFSAAYERYLGNRTDKVTSAFIGGPQVPFVVLPVDVGPNALNMAASVEFAHIDGIGSLQIGYGFGLAKYETSHAFAVAGKIYW
ncbi:autotransporter-associated beta strand protein [Rhodoligotrophos appendicifer]|uniref:autotransporter domain-containing protein n=1 Tax=Rhodoligotrophos appendicifer TaxID=987056 RepID=UPI001186DB27|nr:autotransporter domain-containing protein [Rhodoligotrophos appendicifer]